jgi:ADP-dependent NAD(P)H-hydrate dehydratase / NAD(P)H-hydrate epimerase
MKLLTAAEIRDLDRRAIEDGIPGAVLMENAGRAAAEQVHDFFGSIWPGPVLILAGKGNNGGDGYVVARHLANRGWRIRTLILAPREQIVGEAAVHLDTLFRSEAEVLFAADQDELARALSAQDPRLLIDALFGTGLSSEVRGHYAAAIDWINASGLPVAALDISSGVNATDGRIMGKGVKADLTIAFAFAKPGHVSYPGAGLAGTLLTVDIGIPARLMNQTSDMHLLVDGRTAGQLLPSRPTTGHKGTFGHLLVVAGSPGKSGAAALTAAGGLRAGAGLVTVACPKSVHDILEIKLTEAMTHALPDRDGGLAMSGMEDLRRLWTDRESLALGPGLGQNQETIDLVRQVIRECPLPLVLDADGLNAIAEHPDVLLERRGPAAVLTPHPGEMARLIGGTAAQVEEDRIGIARTFACRYKITLVLKGAATVTAFADGRVRINGSGNPGLASGGMGDVLTGMIGGLLAQGLAVEDAATLGVFLHGLAGDRLSRSMGTAGMIATDLLAEIPAARNEILEIAKTPKFTTKAPSHKEKQRKNHRF